VRVWSLERKLVSDETEESRKRIAKTAGATDLVFVI
jgi:hypothetical protein